MESDRRARTPLPSLRIALRKRPVEMLERYYQWWSPLEDRIAELGMRFSYEEVSELTGVPQDEVKRIYQHVSRYEAVVRGAKR